MIISLLLAVAIQTCSSQISSDDKRNYEIPDDLAIYTSLDKLLNFFRNETNPLAKDILNTFLRDCLYSEFKDKENVSRIKPVIVIEGNHRSSRDIISMGLAVMMNARYMTHPAPCIHRYHPRLPKGTLLRRAYYLLSDYAISFYIKANFNRPVVINGYWTEQIAFTTTQTYTVHNLPPIHSDLYKFPEALLEPDFVFYLNFPDKLVPSFVTSKSPLTWKQRMIDMFKYLQGRHPIVITEVKPLFKLTTEEIHRHIRKNFYDKLHNLTATLNSD